MKKIFGALMTTICIAMTTPVQVQIHFGVKGGLNLLRASFSNTNENLKKGNLIGFLIGPTAEFNIPIVGLGTDASLPFAQRGIKVSEGNGDITVKQNGIDIPVDLKYTIGLGSLAGIYLATGPDLYFDFEKKSGTDKKKAEVGINVGTGLKLLNHLQIGANYNIPSGNTADTEGTDASYKTKTWRMSIAYIF